MQGEYEQDESRSDGVDETAFVSLVHSLWTVLMVVRCERPIERM
jgi:hypothetical protein